jgi:hypothetical protein
VKLGTGCTYTITDRLCFRQRTHCHCRRSFASQSTLSLFRSIPPSFVFTSFSMATIRPDLPDRIRGFLGSLERLGVEADFQRSLNLKWEPSEGKPINLGTIQRNGQVWTDAVNAHAPHDVTHLYIEELASAFGMEVEKETFKGSWHVRTKGHAPRIHEIADKFDAWAAAIERFVTRMKHHEAD